MIMLPNMYLNCNFSKYSSTEGGAIYLYYSGNLSIKACFFDDNFAERGASIYFFQESNIQMIVDRIK